MMHAHPTESADAACVEAYFNNGISTLSSETADAIQRIVNGIPKSDGSQQATARVVYKYLRMKVRTVLVPEGAGDQFQPLLRWLAAVGSERVRLELTYATYVVGCVCGNKSPPLLVYANIPVALPGSDPVEQHPRRRGQFRPVNHP